MTYTQALGSVSSVIGTVGNVVVTAAELVNDAYFPEIVCRVKQIAATRSGSPVPSCSRTAPVTSSSGLHKVIVPLRAYAYAEANPWVYPVAAIAVVGIPFLLGYLVGKK